MQTHNIPEVLPFTLSTELLEHLLEDAGPHTLIVCSTREAFLQELLATVHMAMSARPNPPILTEDAMDNEGQFHSFLVPSMNLIATSKNIRLVFCHTLQHLRAFLSVFTAPESPLTDHSTTTESCRPYLALLNPVTLHFDTTEFSAQGLSRTFALAIDVAARERLNLIMCECNGGEEHVVVRGARLWEVEVPLLNGTVRLGDEDRDWAGRLVKVKRVAERWFIFKMNESKDATPDAMDI